VQFEELRLLADDRGMKCFIWFFCYLLALVPALAKPKPRTLFWLSVDGLSAQLIENSRTPELDRLKAQGWSSSGLVPVFPSSTFPNHATQATGVKVQQHGISGNSFLDLASGKRHSYPGETSLLEAEPIWETLKRQGHRTAVIYWPLSYSEGQHRPDYSMPAYDRNMSDQARIDQALSTWESDLKQGKQLSLIMAYIVGPDTLAHQLGPLDPKVYAQVEAADALIGRVRARLEQIAKKFAQEREFYLMITSDHGMARVTHAVNFHLLSRLDVNSKISVIGRGAVGQVYFDKFSAAEKQQWMAQLKKEYRKHSFVKAFERSELPAEWGFSHSTRTGDLVVVLEKGYSFSDAAPRTVVAVQDMDGGLLGDHGYPADQHPELHGVLYFWRFPGEQGAHQLVGDVSALRLHSTVARLLGATPSKKALDQPIEEMVTAPK
jgi:ectonucleotide pyrophosphatase/phosphodiesterase family member 5